MTAEKATAWRDDATMVRTLSRLRDVRRTVSSPDEDIRGRLVRDEDGRNLGRIKGLLIDDVARGIRFMEVASGGFLGLGERTSFIPVSAITRVTDKDVSISRTGAPAAGASRYDPMLSPSTRATPRTCTRISETPGTWGCSRSRGATPMR